MVVGDCHHCTPRRPCRLHATCLHPNQIAAVRDSRVTESFVSTADEHFQKCRSDAETYSVVCFAEEREGCRADFVPFKSASYVFNPVVPWFASFTKELGAYSKKKLKKGNFKVSKGEMRTLLCLFPEVVFQRAGIKADKVQLSLLFLFVA